MKNREIIELYSVLKKIDHKGAQFNYGVSRNVSRLEPLVIALEKAKEYSPAYQEYEDARVELCKSLATKDELGEPLIINNHYQFTDMKLVKKELDKLTKKHQKALDERVVQMKDVEELLDKEVEFEIFKIKQDYLPQEIKTQEMIAIMDIVE